MPAAVDLSLELDQISCRFASRDDPGKPYLAVSQASLAVREGEFVSIVGPTGCGKSTLLNVAAGLLAPSEGSVRVHGKPLAGINRDAGYMFQADALMPWRSAIDNVTAGLEFRGVPASQAQDALSERQLDPHEDEDGFRRAAIECEDLHGSAGRISVEPGEPGKLAFRPRPDDLLAEYFRL